MRISWNELNQYFTEPLPAPDSAVPVLTDSFCEVESVEQSGDDWIVEVKILPDRSDAKTPEGFARELSALMGWSMKEGLVVATDEQSARMTIEFTPEKLNEILGLSLSNQELTQYLARVRIGLRSNEKKSFAYIPHDRADVNCVEDLADEVMRLVGVGNIPPVPLTALTATAPNRMYEAAHKVRHTLATLGYTEIYSYSFSATGNREVEKSLANHKSFLRANLSDALTEALSRNLQYSMFEKEAVQLFEIGTVFSTDREELRLAVGIAYTKAKYKKETLPGWLRNFSEFLESDAMREWIEIPLARLLPMLDTLPDVDPSSLLHPEAVFKPFSLFPRIIRDIALFVPKGVSGEEVAIAIKESAGPLLVEGPAKFDEFSKEGEERTSLAFRIVFQSHEKSLTDAEVNDVLLDVTSSLEKHPNWEVRK